MKQIKKVRSLAGYAEGGNCFETSLCLGIQLAAKGIGCQMRKGIVRGTTHFWIEVNKIKLDPTKNQFSGLRDGEYPVGESIGCDFEEMVILLGLDRN